MKKLGLLLLMICFLACKNNQEARDPKSQVTTNNEMSEIEKKLNGYALFELTVNLSNLTDNEKKMLPLLIKAADKMNELFWYQAYGDKNGLLDSISDENVKKYIEINYGPWDRMEGDAPFVPGIGEKPLGANFYPTDMTKEEFESFEDPLKSSLYTFIKRDENGKLFAIPYHKQFETQVQEVSNLLFEAAKLAEDAGLKNYLELRAKAFLDDNYRPSDLAWMDMKTNTLDIVIGPIETYEDQLFGNKAAYEGYVLVKDKVWSQKLAKFTKFLPELQKNLPVSYTYKKETPGTDSDLNAYDVVYYAGDCNAAGKTIAINLPNDEFVQLKKGTRRLQLKNAMKAKFDKIMVPISKVLIDETQQEFVVFDAFFANTMFHEVAHGLGIKNTVNNKGTVRNALLEHASAIEEGKADILGLYMVQQLHKKGELDGDLRQYMTTFMAGIFRSVRFGASSAHGNANMICFNFFKEKGAFTKNENGTYKVNYDKMEEAMKQLSTLILTLQGNGDYQGVTKLLGEKGTISADLQTDLDRLSKENIPVDIVFKQGVEVLGLQ